MKKLILVLHFLFLTLLLQAQSTEISPLVLSGISPANNEVIKLTKLKAIGTWAFVNNIDHVASIKFIINGVTVIPENISEGPVFSTPWVPLTYGNYTFKIIATNTNGIISTNETTFTIKHTPDAVCAKVPEWSNQVYAIPGIEVGYNQFRYKNRWYAEANEIPGISNVWKQVRSCNVPIADENCGALPWSKSLAYDQGDTVSYKNYIYRARWWTKGNFPDKREAWKYVSNCSNPVLPFTIFLSTTNNYVIIKTDFAQLRSIKIDIYTISGTYIRTILNQKAFNAPSILYRDISDLEKGLYIYRITIDGQTYSKKMIKQ